MAPFITDTVGLPLKTRVIQRKGVPRMSLTPPDAPRATGTIVGRRLQSTPGEPVKLLHYIVKWDDGLETKASETAVERLDNV